MSVSIKYKGNEIASMTENGTKTLQTKGKYCEDNITVTQTIPPPVEPKDINFYDYDGTLLDAWSLAELAEKTALPDYPTHEGLVCQGWNWTLADIKAASRGLDIGALYITDDGKTRLYINFDKEEYDDFVLNFYQSAANAVTVDWGDGSAAETVASSGYVTIRHAYSVSGIYIISFGVINGQKLSLKTNDERNILSRTSYDYTSSNALRKIEIGENFDRFSYRSLIHCHNLETISCTKDTLVEGSETFAYCLSLRCIVLLHSEMYQSFPNCSNIKIASVGKTVKIKSHRASMETQIKRFNVPIEGGYYSYSLQHAIISDTLTEIVNNAFAWGISLQSMIIPAGVQKIGNYAFQNCYQIKTIICEGNITYVGRGAMANCRNCQYVDFLACTSVPTLANSDAFGDTPADMQIRVPAALADEWKAATNWATYANQIVGV